MKFAVIILLILGLFAAGSAVFLFEWLQVGKARASGPQFALVDVLLAGENLPARTLLTREHLVTDRVPRAGLPQGYFISQAQAIGKTLKMAVVKGQALSESCCIPKGSVDDLLRPGMLAFPVQLSRRSASTELLYPGCIVDVFATFPLRDRTKGEAVVTPLLQSIQVLGLADETVLSAQRKTDPAAPKKKSAQGNVTVTLEVTARQAAALQLAMEQGSLGLPMRNPLDKKLNPMDPMVVKEGQLTAASESMDPQTLALVNRLQQMLGNGTVRAMQTTCPPPAFNPLRRLRTPMTIPRPSWIRPSFSATSAPRRRSGPPGR